MAEDLRIVYYNELDQIVTLLNLEERRVIYKLAGTFSVQLGSRTAVYAAAETRRGGSVQVDERRELGTVGATWMVRGLDVNECISRMESLLAQADNSRRGVYILWQADGSSYQTMYKVVGAATVTNVQYKWPQFVEGMLPVEITWPVQPVVEEPLMDMTEDFRARHADDADLVYNEVLNPRADVDTTAWISTVPGSHTISRVATTTPYDGTQGEPPSQSYILSTSATPSGTSFVVLAGRVTTVDFTEPYATTVKSTDSVYMVGSVRAESVSGTTFASIRIRARCFGVTGTSLGDIEAVRINSPTTGQVYHLSGTISAASIPAGTTKVVWGATAVFTTTPTTFTWSCTNAMLVVSPPPTNPTPAFFDGNSAWGRWTGTALFSKSALMERSKLDEYWYDPTLQVWKITQGAFRLGSPAAGTSTSIVALGSRRPFRHGAVTVSGRGVGTGFTSFVVTPGIGYDPVDNRCYFGAFDNDNLRIFEFDGSTTVQRATTSVSNPLQGVEYWLRIRRTTTTVVLDYFTAAPAPQTTPTNTVTYTWGTTGTTIRDRAGYAVLRSFWNTPGATEVSEITSFKVEPFFYRAQPSPVALTIETLPGTTLAKVDIDVTCPASDSDFPRYMLYAWRRILSFDATGCAITSMLVNSESATALGGSGSPAINSVSTFRGPSSQAVTFTGSSAETSGWADYRFNPLMWEADEFDDAVTLAIFVRWHSTSYTPNTFVNPRLRAELCGGADDGIFAQSIYTPEFGSNGHPLVTNPVVSPPVGQFRLCRTSFLGTLRVPIQSELLDIRVSFLWSVGSASVLMYLDEMYVVPVRRMSLGATGKNRDDGTYSAFLPNLAYTRRLFNNNSGAIASSTGRFVSNPVNQGGAEIELPQGGSGVELLCRPSVSVIDDPTTAANDIEDHNATYHLRVIPRHHLLA